MGSNPTIRSGNKQVTEFDQDEAAGDPVTPKVEGESFCDRSSAAERRVPNASVVGSNPIDRSMHIHDTMWYGAVLKRGVTSSGSPHVI